MGKRASASESRCHESNAIKPWAMEFGPSPDDYATLLANRSLCSLRLGENKMLALSDATTCRMMRPHWPKACYRQGAAYMSLKEYEKACAAFADGLKLEPTNDDIAKALRVHVILFFLSMGSCVHGTVEDGLNVQGSLRGFEECSLLWKVIDVALVPAVLTGEVEALFCCSHLDNSVNLFLSCLKTASKKANLLCFCRLQWHSSRLNISGLTEMR